MALLNLFGKKRKEPTKPKKAAVEAAPEQAAEESRPSIIAPASPALRSFHVSEKSSRGMQMNQYTFVVAPRATKTEVRDAVERAYKVKVTGVNIVKLPAKKRRLGRREGVVSARKKAIVTLKDGQTIAAAQP
jgi:large subunit ribosomal protein L23